MESDFEFYSYLVERIPGGVTLLHAENLSTLEQLPNYVADADIVVIDSTHRVHDSEIVCRHLVASESKKLQMIIFDNSERYSSLIKSISEKLNLIQIDFIGLGPINDYEWTTSILINRNFNITNTRTFSSISTFPYHVNHQISDMDKEIDEEYKPTKSFSLNEIDIQLNEILKIKNRVFTLN